MAETAALHVDNVLPRQPVRQWVLSLPMALRYLLAARPELVTQVPDGVYRRAGKGCQALSSVLIPATASLRWASMSTNSDKLYR